MVDFVQKCQRLRPDIEWSDFFENVDSMNDTDREAITMKIAPLRQGGKPKPPYRVNAAAFGPVNRPRYYWMKTDVQDAPVARSQGHVQVKAPPYGPLVNMEEVLVFSLMGCNGPHLFSVCK